MTWACKRCGLQRDPWVLVCDVDGTLRFEPESDDRPTTLEPVVYGPLERVHRGEVALIGTIADGVTAEQARQEIETIAHEVLANPVIEEYRVEILD